MPQRPALPRKGIPFLHEKQIAAEANLLNEEYGLNFSPILAPPVPVDEIAELHCGLTLEYLDMASLFPQAEVHGAIWFQERRIGIDHTLDPDTHPAKRGRYHFTLAHELGHWRLHRRHYRQHPQEQRLFENGQLQPDVICRSGDTLRVEWQANAFAAELLMPRKLVLSAWTEFRNGDERSVAITELRQQVSRPDGLLYRGRQVTEGSDFDFALKEEFCRPLAEQFEVSREAMRIQLERMGLLVTKTERTLW
ncbi:hypothetical protein KOR42_49370 [Thalassoglobus neptunius]|uniref:IrrE N-terminal-like domain-containing protein n=1 Tax=Thalassoglobus neptunius TaxID=1938619 RepID=A0A5C5VQH9_9PLAN|nr:ImmA/IrrE family metallo-endopeptidase [Thalassoglobus neptunius]TWT40195.1 hypothetical protein KOR42_49370 [Thalassoglobus neptunius]